MIKYSLYITEDQEQKLKNLSKETKTNVSEHIRIAISNYLKMIEEKSYSQSPSKRANQNE